MESLSKTKLLHARWHSGHKSVRHQNRKSESWLQRQMIFSPALEGFILSRSIREACKPDKLHWSCIRGRSYCSSHYCFVASFSASYFEALVFSSTVSRAVCTAPEMRSPMDLSESFAVSQLDSLLVAASLSRLTWP